MRVPGSIPEYDGNPFIRALPPVTALATRKEAMARPPSYDPSERRLTPTLRRHCVLRLQSYYRPLPRHLIFADQFDMLIRQGYVGRNPVDRAHEARMVEAGDRSRVRTLLDGASPLAGGGNARSAVLVGLPGMGKSLAVEETLSAYPQVVRHEGLPPQIVWVKLDCPPRGSLRALCVDFFHKVDALLGQDTYTRLYAGSNASEESMMSHMALVANMHALGCFVIDEIQHLPRTGDEQHQLMVFLVTLVNTIGVPVLFIGTLSAAPLFESTARMARRSVGVGSAVWDNYKADDLEWKGFLDDLWQYQWTSAANGLTPSLRKVIYDETQGVVDFVVKLFALVQINLIMRTEGSPEYPELIDEHVIRQVAREDFRPIRGLIDALRSGDWKAVAKFEDISPWHREVADKMVRRVGAPSMEELSIPRRRPDGALGDEDEGVDAGMAERMVRAGLAKRGYGDEIIARVIAEAGAGGDAGADPIAFTARVEKLVRAATKQVRRPAAKVMKGVVEGDLRVLAQEATKQGRTVCELFADHGVAGRAEMTLAE